MIKKSTVYTVLLAVAGILVMTGIYLLWQAYQQDKLIDQERARYQLELDHYSERNVYYNPQAISDWLLARLNPQGYFVQNPDKHPMGNLAELLAEVGLGAAHIGVEMDNYYYTASAHMTLMVRMGQATFADATGLVNWQRAVKSPQEITYMRRAARIVEAMHARILETAEPGMRKNDLIAEIYATGIKGADGHWGDYPAIVPMAPSGLSYAPRLDRTQSEPSRRANSSSISWSVWLTSNVIGRPPRIIFSYRLS